MFIELIISVSVDNRKNPKNPNRLSLIYQALIEICKDMITMRKNIGINSLTGIQTIFH